MASKTTAPYGEWRSPISIESVASKTRSLSTPRASVGSLPFALNNR